MHRDERGGDVVEDRFDAPAEFADLGGEGLPAAGDGGERVTRRAVGRGGEGGPPAGGQRDFLLERQVPELGADPLGGGVDEAVELVGGCGAGLHRPCSRHAQLTQRLDGTGAGLRGHGGVTGEHRPRRGFGVDGVGLAAPATVLSVGSVHLHHPHVTSSEVAGQPRAPRPTPLDTDRDELTEAAQPCQQAPVPVACRSKRRGVQDPTEVIDHRGDVDVLVGIDPAEDPAFARGLRDRGHATPSINQDWMARTAGRADRTVIGPFAQAPLRSRSPTGACDTQGLAHPADWSHPRHQQRPADMRVRPGERDPARSLAARNPR
jgi:hypothetical protein